MVYNEHLPGPFKHAGRHQYCIAWLTVIKCLISASEACLQSDGVVDPTSSFAGVLLAWIASAITVELMQSSTSSARADKTSLSPDNQELNQI